MLERVLLRDSSPATVAAVLPTLRLAASASEGTESELSAAGQLAQALSSLRPEEAEVMLRQVIERAIGQGDHHIASVAIGDLVNLLLGSGRLQEALAESERKADLSVRAGAGAWTQLFEHAHRLQILAALGEHEHVLSEVAELRLRMAELPDQRGADDTVDPWMAREVLLDTGQIAALHLERWEEGLAFGNEYQESQRRRQAPLLEQARTACNAVDALRGLGRVDEMRVLLDWCREVYEREHYLAGLGQVFGALAALEAQLGHHDDARQFGERALRYEYLTGHLQDVVIGHNNLAVWLDQTGQPHEQAVAHRLASLLVSFQTDSGHLWSLLVDLRRTLSAQGAQGSLPVSFDELCERVDQLPGVRFRELFSRLPQRAPNGHAALAKVLSQIPDPDPDPERLLPSWQLIIAVAVAAAHGDQDGAEDLRPVLADLAETSDWAALSAAIQRLLDQILQRL